MMNYYLEQTLTNIKQDLNRLLDWPTHYSDAMSVEFDLAKMAVKSLTFDGYVNETYTVKDDQSFDEFIDYVNSKLAYLFNPERYVSRVGTEIILLKDRETKAKFLSFDKESGKMKIEYENSPAVGWVYVNQVWW